MSEKTDKKVKLEKKEKSENVEKKEKKEKTENVEKKEKKEKTENVEKKEKTEKKLKSEERCINITDLGERCKLKKLSGKDLCHVHSDKTGNGSLNKKSPPGK
jgi:hypothetical protein